MSVFTPVTRRSLEPFLARYHVGSLVNFHGISEGVENTNYFVDTSDGQFVLTLFCLLYTSPSPRDRTRSRMPSSA